MNKNSKNFFETVGLLIWALLLTSTFIVWAGDFATWIRLGILIVTIVYAIVEFAIMFKIINDEGKQYIKDEEQKLLDLKKLYSDYIRLVDEQTTKTLIKIGSDVTDTLGITTVSNCNYIIDFANKLDWICKNRIKGKPDSFIIATCLLYSIIKKPRLIPELSDNFKNDIDEIRKIMFSINLDIAMNCAFKIISEPITYYENESEEWLEEKHPKVDIVVPKGIIKNVELYQRIVNNIYKDYKSDHSTSIMQFSNLLHLIYLNCQ